MASNDLHQRLNNQVVQIRRTCVVDFGQVLEEEMEMDWAYRNIHF